MCLSDELLDKNLYFAQNVGSEHNVFDEVILKISQKNFLEILLLRTAPTFRHYVDID
jgi:hypothetical protein